MHSSRGFSVAGRCGSISVPNYAPPLNARYSNLTVMQAANFAAAFSLPNMYFTEFEFCLTDVPGYLYWFPVLINSSNVEYAGAVKNGITGRLTKKFNLLRASDLLQYERPFYSENLRALAALQQKGEIEKLNLEALTLSSFEKEVRITLTSQYQIVPQMLLEGHPHTITNKLNRRGFLTTQFHSDVDYQKEFLVMKFESKGVPLDEK